MGLSVLNPKRYGALCSAVVPKVIESDQEFDRLSAKLEELTFKTRPTREEVEMAKLLESLLIAYDNATDPPDVPPHEMVSFFMQQRNLRQADLVPAIGTRAQVSEIVSGRRGVSKAQAKKLAVFFHTSAELFI